MRDDEKHLVEVPLKQLSRLSTLITTMRGDFNQLPGYSEINRLLTDFVESSGEFEPELWKSIANMISEAVWPSR